MSIRGRIFCSKTVFLMLAGLCVVCMARNAAAAGGAIKASGMLMSVEKDRSVIIDKQGYLTVASTKIIDTKGNTSRLDKFHYPPGLILNMCIQQRDQ